MIVAPEWFANGSAVSALNTIRDKVEGKGFSDLMSSNMINNRQLASISEPEADKRLVNLIDTESLRESLGSLSEEQLDGIADILNMINNKLENTDNKALSQGELMTFITENLNDDQIDLLEGQLEVEDQEVLMDLIKKLLEIDHIGESKFGETQKTPEQYTNFYFSDSFLVQNNIVQKNQSREDALTEKAKSLVEQTEKMLQQIQNQTISSRDYKQILQLLKQWSQMNNQSLHAAQNLLTEATNEKSNEIWSKLLANFQNRTSMQQHYGSTQKVTQQDVKRWIEGAMERIEPVMKQEQAQIVRNDTGTQQVQSKVQQYVIHLSQTNSDQQIVQKQLIDQFQQVMQKSNFMKLASGTNQLMLKLQPEHLGDITVKLTQINGEMTVKMIASTQGAKELLEGNLKQLRHMFSPQQVIIEKQENFSQVNQEELTDDNLNSQGEDQQEQTNDQEQEENNAEHQNLSFHDILMDAKV
ncbi:flagellar hook-length control protein FliK [Gracilibacillus lacisalsi]|uniref:flagellar hook-length control protein FliK n=1 Tax=Gracilibacillus lacisalsi TaxID=393087 RepID=UPI00035EBF7F|nr:flagellar hook-length control protein FliK [Gracilibacillus lacisalsi]